MTKAAKKDKGKDKGNDKAKKDKDKGTEGKHKGGKSEKGAKPEKQLPSAASKAATSVRGQKTQEPAPRPTKRQKVAADAPAAAQPLPQTVPSSAAPSASSLLEHCDLCMDNNSVKPFALSQGMALASPRQCYRCYLLWIPVSLLMDWLQMVNKYRTEAAFQKRIDEALNATARRAPGHRLFQPQKLAQT